LRLRSILLSIAIRESLTTLQLERVRASEDSSVGRTSVSREPLLSPTRLLRAIEKFGQRAGGGAAVDDAWVDDAVFTAVHACLVRAAFLELPTLLDVAGKDIMPDMPDILRTSYADRVDGDTYVTVIYLLCRLCVMMHLCLLCRFQLAGGPKVHG
jgi:hypothetical protein